MRWILKHTECHSIAVHLRFGSDTTLSRFLQKINSSLIMLNQGFLNEIILRGRYATLDGFLFTDFQLDQAIDKNQIIIT